MVTVNSIVFSKFNHYDHIIGHNPFNNNIHLFKVSSNGSSTNSQSLTEIEDLISNLNLDITDMELETLLELAQNSPSDDASIKKMAEIVYSKCVKDREFSKTGAFICDKLAAVENNGTKFRSSLLSLVQTDYKGRLMKLLVRASIYGSFGLIYCQFLYRKFLYKKWQ